MSEFNLEQHKEIGQLINGNSNKSIFSIELKTLHFDLCHSGRDHNYQLHYGGKRYDLTLHDETTRYKASQQNAGLASLSPEKLANVTHYVTDVPTRSNIAHLAYVTRKMDGLAVNELQPLSLVFHHIPSDAMESIRREKPELCGCDPRLKELGISLTAEIEDQIKVLAGLDNFKSPRDAAIAVVGTHPQLVSSDQQTSARIVNNHIATASGLGDLITAISSQGENGWAVVTPSVDKDGKPFQWGPKWGERAGKTVNQYNLTALTEAAMPKPISSACKSSQNDSALQNKSWSTYQGTPNQPVHPPESSAIRTKFDTVRNSNFTLNNLTPGVGISYDIGSLSYTAGNTPQDPAAFSINMSNSFLRILWAWVQYLDDKGNVFDSNGQPAPANHYESLGLVTSVNTIIGIPIPTDPTNLAFKWPEQASMVRIINGGMGGGANFDGAAVVGQSSYDLCWRGMLMTGCFQYAIPFLFFAAGAAIENTSWYKSFIKGIAALEQLESLSHSFNSSLAANSPSLTSAKNVLSSLGDGFAGYVVSNVAEKIGLYIAAKLVEAEIIDAVPVVGWIARAASMVIMGAQMLETTVEISLSPAIYMVEVKRLVPVAVTVHPDPVAGTKDVPATWPDVAAGGHYLFQIQYKDGTNYSQRGDMPDTTNANAIIGQFPDLPSGGRFQVIFGVYTKDNWLAGQWTSSWIEAVLTAGNTIINIEGSIIQSLARLTPKTKYKYEESLRWNAKANAHVWQTDQPTAILRNLDCTTGYCQPASLTINEKAFMLGYTWQAGGQNITDCNGANEDGQLYVFQNINTGATPQASLKYSGCGFTDEPALIYDQFGPAPLLSLPLTDQTALDDGKLTADILAAFDAVKRALPKDATLTTSLKTAVWTIGWSNQSSPGYVLRRNPVGIDVFVYPDSEFSQRNFYVDPGVSDGLKYNLRHVVLDNSTPFEMDSKLSWGRFNSSHLQAFAIHPAGYVIGANNQYDRLEILKLPTEAVPDENAPLALVVSGTGDRQGLLDEPVHLTVAADGRILVLENSNQRVQSFDLNGNPSPSFDGVQRVMINAANFKETLDKGHAALELRKSLLSGGVNLTGRWQIVIGNDLLQIEPDNELLIIRKNGEDLSTFWDLSDSAGTYKYHLELTDGNVVVDIPGTSGFTLPAKAQDSLLRGTVTPDIIAAFHANGIEISPQSVAVGNVLSINREGSEDSLALGIIPQQLIDALKTRGIALDSAAVVNDVIAVTVLHPGSEWIIRDVPLAASLKLTLTADGSQIKVVDYLSYFPLRVAGNRTFLSISCELLGYVYVLSYNGAGDKVEDYILDIYEPNGNWLNSTSGVNAALIVVNQWRTVYTLDYQSFTGPGGRIEPSVSVWIPTDAND